MDFCYNECEMVHKKHFHFVEVNIKGVVIMGKFKVSKYESMVINGFLVEGVTRKNGSYYGGMTCVNCHKLQPKEICISHLLSGNVSCRFCHTKFIEPEYEIKFLKGKWRAMNDRVKNDKHYRHVENNFENFEEFYSHIYPQFKQFQKEHNGNLADMEIGRPNPLGNYGIGNCEVQERGYNRKHERQCFKPFLAQEIKTGKMYVSWSQMEFARKYNCDQGSVGSCLRGKSKKHHGFRFRYLSPKENSLFNEEKILYATGILNFDDPL